VNFLDTSRHYGFGRSEERSGAVIGEQGSLPEGLVISTKLDRGPEINALIPLAPDLADAAQHLGRDAVILHDGIPIAKTAELPLDHKGPDPFGGFVQQGGAGFLVRTVLSGIKCAQRRKGLFDLAAQVSESLRLLLEDFIVEYAPSGLWVEAG
jgi:hypothetical protein